MYDTLFQQAVTRAHAKCVTVVTSRHYVVALLLRPNYSSADDAQWWRVLWRCTSSAFIGLRHTSGFVLSNFTLLITVGGNLAPSNLHQRGYVGIV